MECPWGLGVPHSDAGRPGGATSGALLESPGIFAEFKDRHWSGNSRNKADESVIRAIASMANFQPVRQHESDSLELVEDLILAGPGVGLLPLDRPVQAGLSILPLANPDVGLRAFARTRQGRSIWPALALV